jgi:hypothetical protein
MKLVSFFSVFLASFCLNAQVEQAHLVISFHQVSFCQHPGKMDYTQVLTNSGITHSDVYYSKEYNFNHYTVTCFENGIEYYSGPIDSLSFDPEKGYVLYFTEKDLRNDQLIPTMQVIDVKNKKGYYTWYWDGMEDATYVEVEELTEIRSYP